MSAFKQKLEKFQQAMVVLGYLKAKAQDKKLVSYPEVASALGFATTHQLGSVLKMVMEECSAASEPLYPALIVNRSGRPGQGFYDQSRGLGYAIEESEESEEAFWLWQVHHKLGLDAEVYNYQQPRDSLWKEQLSLLEALGYEVEYQPLYENPPHATFLRGKKLVQLVVHRPKQAEAHPGNIYLEQYPDIREMLETGNFRAKNSSTEAIQELRQKLQDFSRTILCGKEPLAPELIKTLMASKLPSGNLNESASQLPG